MNSVYAFNINMRIMHFVFSYCLNCFFFTFTTLPSRNIKNPRAYCLLLFSLMLTTTDNTATLASHYKLNLLDDRERLNEDNEEKKVALVESFKHQGIEEAKALHSHRYDTRQFLAFIKTDHRYDTLHFQKKNQQTISDFSMQIMIVSGHCSIQKRSEHL